MLRLRRSAAQRAGALLLHSCLFIVSQCPAANDRARLVVDDFDGGIQNAMSGYRNSFARFPSSAKSQRTDAEFHGQNGKSLRLEGDRQQAGYCGQWIHLFDMRSKTPRYLDVREYSHLSFWIKGEQSGERLAIHLADRHYVAKEDSVLVGLVTDFLPGGVSTTWQEVLVPLAEVQKVNLGELAAVTFTFTSPGGAVVYLDDLAFQCRPVSETRGSSSAPSVKSPAYRTRPRSMWVWTSREILADKWQTDELLSCCAQQHIRELWMQLTYRLQRATNASHADGSECIIDHVPEWRNLLKRAHAAGVAVHALDGAPEHAIQVNHHIPLSVVESLIAFNKNAEPAERFDGIHFDNEPYLLLGWSDPTLRERILSEFLLLNAKCQARVSESRDGPSGLEFGIDIPFWWQERETPEGPCLGDVTFRGKRQPASYHCLELLDRVGIMNYRDSADGADGMIFHGRDLLEHAAKSGRSKVYMGVETTAIAPARVRFALGLPKEHFSTAIRQRGASLAFQSRWRDLRLHRFDDGMNMHVGIEVHQHAADSRNAEDEALREIASVFGMDVEPSLRGRLVLIEEQVAAAIRQNSEWRELKWMAAAHSTKSARFPCFEATNVSLAKITFAEESLDEFRTQTALAEQEFSRSPAYAGIAIHAYESFRVKISNHAHSENGR